jgi:hypothetical protein
MVRIDTKRNERKDVVCKHADQNARNDAQRNETREAECKGVNETQLGVSRAKEKIVTKEDESAAIRNDAVKIECERT